MKTTRLFALLITAAVLAGCSVKLKGVPSFGKDTQDNARSRSKAGTTVESGEAPTAAQGADRSTSARQQTPRARAAALIRELDPIYVKGQVAVPADGVAELGAKVEEFSDDPASSYFREVHHRYAVYNAWFEAAPAKALARLKGATLEGEGKTSGKKAAVRIKAQKDTCYQVVARWPSPGEVVEADWRWPADSSPLQRFDYLADRRAPNRTWGACATRAADVSLELKLDFAGTANGLQYAVLSWRREQTPLAVTYGLTLRHPDPCDTEAWEALWTRPVPGTLVYWSNEPHLMTSADGNGSVWASVRSLAGSERRVSVAELRHAPEGAVAVSSKWHFRECPWEGGEHPDSIKWGACVRKVGAKTDAEYARQSSDKAHAKSAYAHDVADQKLRELDARNRSAIDRTCGAILKPVEKHQEKAFNKVVDAFIAKPVVDVIDRPSALRDATKAF
jgi:hypothetical protein